MMHAWFEHVAWMIPSAFHSLLWASVFGSSVAIVAYLFQKLMGRFVSAKLLYVLWVLVVLRFVLFLVPASPMSIQNLFAETESVPIALVERQGPIPEFITVVESASVAESEPVALTLPVEPIADSINKSKLDWIRMVWNACQFVWLAGVLVLFLRLAIQAVAIGRLVRGAAPLESTRVITIAEKIKKQLKLNRDVTLKTTHRLDAPAVVGWLRPVILLPQWCEEELSDSQLRLVFAHELIHVRRHDVLVQLLVHFVAMLHWFNPLVRYARNQIEAYREMSCDQRVLNVIAADRGNQINRLYGETILQIAEYCDCRDTKQPGWVPGFIGRQGNLVSERIQMLGKYKNQSTLAKCVGCVVATLMIAVGFTSAQESIIPNKSALTGQDSNAVDDPVPVVSGQVGDPSRFKVLEEVTLRVRVFEGTTHEIVEILKACASEGEQANLGATLESEARYLQGPLRNFDGGGTISHQTLEKIEDRLDGLHLSHDSRIHGGASERLVLNAEREVDYMIDGPIQTRSVGINVVVEQRWLKGRMVASIKLSSSVFGGDIVQVQGNPVPKIIETEANTTVLFARRDDTAIVCMSKSNREHGENTKLLCLVSPVSFKFSDDIAELGRVFDEDVGQPEAVQPVVFMVPMSTLGPIGAAVKYEIESFRGKKSDVAELIRGAMGSDDLGYSLLGSATSDRQKRLRSQIKKSSLKLESHPRLTTNVGMPAELFFGQEVPLHGDGVELVGDLYGLGNVISKPLQGKVKLFSVGTKISLVPALKGDSLVHHISLRVSKLRMLNVAQVYDPKLQEIRDVSPLMKTEVATTMRLSLGETALFCLYPGRSPQEVENDASDEAVMILVTRRDPAKALPRKTPSVPVRVEPARVDPVRVEPARVDPVRVEPARVDPVRLVPNGSR